jgi:ATP-binding protein involved in chromosome partitioning
MPPNTTHHDPEAQVTNALSAVQRSTDGASVLDEGLVADVSVADGSARIAVDPDALAGEDGSSLAAALVTAAESVDGVESAHVESVAGHHQRGAVTDETENTASEERTPGVEAFDHVVAVASTKGGVGKSTVAANLAAALARDADVGLFDADVYGPNVPSLLDVDEPVHSTDGGNPIPVEADGVEVMSVGLLADDAPLAWRGAMAHEALADLFGDTAWANDDVLVVDLPPGTGDTVLTTLQEVPVDGVLFVTTPFHTSVADTERGCSLFRENDVPVLGVVRNMGTFECPSCGDDHRLFPEMGGLDVDAPVLADLSFDRSYQETVQPGDPPAGFADLADDVLDRVRTAWDADVPADAVDLRDVPPDQRRDRVRAAFEDVSPGEEFALVSDRDPSPVREFLADLAGTEPEDFPSWSIERATPETWLLRTEHP